MWKHISCILLHPQLKFSLQLVGKAFQNTCKIQRTLMMQMIRRNIHACRKREQILVARKGYSTRMTCSSVLLHRKLNLFAQYGIRNSHNVRFYSSMKDDEMVKSWLGQIQDDFEKESKGAVKDKHETGGSSEESSTSDESESDEDDLRKASTEELDDLENDIEKLETLGFTTEEIIDLLKKAKMLDDKVVEDDSELSGSDSENESGGSLQSKVNNVSNEKNDRGKKEGTDGSTNKMEKEEWAVVKMNRNEKTDWSALEVEDFVNLAQAEPDVGETWQSPVDFVRGKTGVYEIEDLIKVLRAGRAEDVMTIHVPRELDFADYMVIVSAKSQRHMKAITADVKWIYKRRKHRSDKFLKVEGEHSDWHAMDLGNIILHVFLPATRHLYDLETLWTVGAKFDPQCQAETKDPFVFSASDLPWLKELEEASKAPK